MALSKIDVANMLTGATPVANGGTALTSGFANGITEVDHWRITSTYTDQEDDGFVFTSNWERVDTDSFEKIGTSAIQSRALAALINTTYVFCLPGSNGACKDGWDEILKYQLDIRHRPCNFVEIMPRLSEK